jgi:glycosyltransferase involved in cell wall biosynthesis
MKIGIDASRAFLYEKTGTEEYSHEIIRHITKIESSDHQIFLFVRKETKIDFELPANFFVREVGGDFLWTQLHLSWELFRNKVDLLFVPSHSIPWFHPSRTFVTIHGLEYKNCPESYSGMNKIFLEINTRLSLIFAKKIIVPSVSSKNDLKKFYRVEPHRIKVIYHGFNKPANNVHIKKGNKFNLFFIGRIEKRKNIIRLVKAFNKFMEDINFSEETGDRKIILTLAGKNGFGFEEIEKEIIKSPYRNNILKTGYVPPELKQELYRNADVFVFPSSCEGFGLPVLEAMGFGVPVICSDSSAIREIAGDAAVIVDPNDTERISAAIMQIYNNPNLKKKLTEKGYNNIEKFSWEKCAEETWGVLNQSISDNSEASRSIEEHN